jgi:hypothetical protein
MIARWRPAAIALGLVGVLGVSGCSDGNATRTASPETSGVSSSAQMVLADVRIEVRRDPG